VPLAFIPSPSSPFVLQLGPLNLRWYGLLLALAVVLGIRVTQFEFARRGVDESLVGAVAIWAVPLGLVGARLYHVATDWAAFSGHVERIPAIWQGGLGIYGAVAGGALGAYVGGRRIGFPWPTLFDCIAPALAVAQALGRFGNYFNQELFGRPSSLPWALRIDLPHRPPGYELYATFQPTFLYESLWDLLVFAVLLAVARRRWRAYAGGALFALYLALYSLGRFFVEGLRIDPAHHLGPLRLNQVVSGVIAVLAAVAFAALRRRGGPPALPASAAADRPD
jgi:prolipoprotein diacylglyceryl transferase